MGVEGTMTLTCPCCGRRLARLVPDTQYKVTIHCQCGHKMEVEVGPPPGAIAPGAQQGVGPTEHKGARC